MKNKYKKIGIAVYANPDRDGVYDVKIEDLEIPLTGVKRYYHSLFRLLNLTGCDRAFLDWLTEVMGSDNSVYVNNDEIERFIATVRHKKEYKVSTVWQSFKRLRGMNLLLKVKKASGLFHVSPIFYSKGSEKDRVKAIQMIMDFDPNDDEETKELRVRIFMDIKENLK